MLTKDQALEQLAKLQATGDVTTKKLMELDQCHCCSGVSSDSPIQ